MKNYLVCGYFSILAVLLTVLFSACDIHTPNYRIDKGKQIGRIAVPEPTGLYNANNPFDSIGYWHNHILVNMFTMITDTSDLATMDTFIEKLDSGFVNYYCTLGLGGYARGRQLLLDAKTHYNEQYDNLVNINYLSNFSNDTMTTKEIYYIHRIGAVIESQNMNSEITRDSISAIETDICSDSWGEYETSAYIQISIMKYSYEFWRTFADTLNARNLRIGRSETVTEPQVKALANGDLVMKTEWGWRAERLSDGTMQLSYLATITWEKSEASILMEKLLPVIIAIILATWWMW